MRFDRLQAAMQSSGAARRPPYAHHIVLEVNSKTTQVNVPADIPAATRSNADDAKPDNGAVAQDFERSLAELESIVETLERGELSLDDSLKHFERGVQLTRVCQAALRQAEQKVEILMRKSGQFEPAPFDATDNDRDG